MSFVGKKNSQNEIKMKEKNDENLKITINDKIFEMMTKNNTIKEKIEKIKQKNYLLHEDEEYLEKIISESKNTLENIKNLIKDFENTIQRKYSQDIHLKDKLNLIKQQMCKTIDKEIENFNKNSSNFQAIKINLAKKTEVEYNENNSLLNDKNDEDNQKFKVSANAIKYYEDIANYRVEKTKNLYSEVLLVNKISNDINMLTHQQDKKISQIDDNIEPVLLNAKDTFKKLIEASEEDKRFKNNNCCIIFLIVIAISFLFLILINMSRA